MSTKAMKLALEALEGLKSIPGGRHELHELNAIHRKHDLAITTLREALAEQPAQQEPFGYFKAEPFGWTDCAETDEGAVALYTTSQPAQRTWAGLTNKDVYECEPKTDWYDSVEFARAIEAKLRSKNT